MSRKQDHAAVFCRRDAFILPPISDQTEMNPLNPPLLNHHHHHHLLFAFAAGALTTDI